MMCTASTGGRALVQEGNRLVILYGGGTKASQKADARPSVGPNSFAKTLCKGE